MKKSIALLLSVLMILSLAACGSSAPAAKAAPASADAEKTVYTIGICNFVDDASLNQIIANIRERLGELETDTVAFEILEDNCNLDANVMNQIITNFIAQDVDLMVGVATPVAMGMQAATEENRIPVVFAAVSDPLGAGLVESMDAPGANLTGTSDYLDTNAVMNLIFALNPDAKKIGLLYNVSEDSSTAPIAAAKEYLTGKGVAVVEHTGTNVDEGGGHSALHRGGQLRAQRRLFGLRRGLRKPRPGDRRHDRPDFAGGEGPRHASGQDL